MSFKCMVCEGGSHLVDRDELKYLWINYIIVCVDKYLESKTEHVLLSTKLKTKYSFYLLTSVINFDVVS